MRRILGQNHAVATLLDALASGRVHHAWIFSGPRGVGKFTTALELARILLDPAESTASSEPDAGPGLFAAGPEPAHGSGPSIQNPKSKIQNLIDAGTHPDLHVIRKELALSSDIRDLRERKQLNIPIDLLRERMIGGPVSGEHRTAPLALTSVMGHGKVFIIDEAELLEPTSQNALLKSLEEPPPRTYIILVTARPERLLSTIHSRCQHLRFGLLNVEAMRAWMQSSAELKAQGEEARAWIESFAAGSPGAALLAAEYGFHSWQAALDPMLADLDAGRFPLEMGETLAGFVDEFAKTWVKRHANASKEAANKFGSEQVISLLAAWNRRRIRAAIEAGRDPGLALVALDLLVEAERQLQSNTNLKLVMENLVAQWTAGVDARAANPVIA